VWALKLTPEWVGTAARTDILLADNVRRYYIPSTSHGSTTVAAPGTMFSVGLRGSLLPPPIKQVIKMLVPRVDADGNELGGVPLALNMHRLAPISGGL
jgi:hypothetical protein